MVVKVLNWYPSAEGMQTGVEDFAIQGRVRLAMRRVAGSMMNKYQPNNQFIKTSHDHICVPSWIDAHTYRRWVSCHHIPCAMNAYPKRMEPRMLVTTTLRRIGGRRGCGVFLQHAMHTASKRG